MNVTVLRGATSIKLPASLRGNLIKNGQGETGYIKGIVTEKTVPVSRRVLCYHRLSGGLVGSVWSDSNGNYTFTELIAGVEYFVTAVDQNKDAVQYNAVTQDLVVASEVIL